MPLQEWIHALEEGKGVVWIKRIFLVLAFAGLAALYDIRNFKNFTSPEAMDSAQIARQLATGHGFTTKFIRPLSVRLMMENNGETFNPLKIEHPDLANAPVFPVIEAGLMKLLPFNFQIANGSIFWRYQPEVLIAIFNQVLLLALLGSIFILGKTLFDASVATVTVVVTGLTEVFWKYSISGLPTLFLCVLLVWIFWCLARMEQRAREQTGSNGWFIGMSIALGALVAIGALTRYSFGWLVLPVVAFALAFFGQRRGSSATIIILVFLIALAPWCYRNYSICGRPFGIAEFAAVDGTPFFPKGRLERAMPAKVAAELNKVSVDQFRRKLVTGVSDAVRNEIPKLGGSWVVSLFLVGLLAPFRNPGLSRLRYFVLVSLVLLLAVQSLGRTYLSDLSPDANSESLLLLLTPVVLLYGVALFYSFLDQHVFAFPPLRLAAISSFVVVVSLPILLSAFGRTFPFAFPPYYPPNVREVANWMKPEELVMSDMPWAVAWYGDRRCVWTTLDTGYATPSDFFTIHDHIQPVKLLYLTPITLDVKFVSDMLKGSEAAWSRFALDGMVRTNVPPGFPLKHSPRGYLPDFLILTDRKRW